MVSGGTKGDQSSHTEYKGEGGLWEIDYQWVGGKHLNTTEP